MKLFSKALAALAAAASLSQAHPTEVLTESKQIDERADVQIVGTRVAVVTGIVLTQTLIDCFGRDGMAMAKGWAGALYDQWYYSGVIVVDIMALVSDRNINGKYCITVDAVFQFVNGRDAQKFATFISSVVGKARLDAASVAIEGIDLPFGHDYFGANLSNITRTNPIHPTTELSKRGWSGCQNSCGFSFTKDQTRSCRAAGFPKENASYC